MEGFVHPDFAPVTEKMQQLMDKRSAIGGMAVAVYHHGELVADAWTGVADAAGTPWGRDTMSISFSTTKGVVATIAHRLADRGLLDYDAKVADYWPEFAAAGKEQITVRHLLTHQAAMHDVRRLADTTEELLDWDRMTAAARGRRARVGGRSLVGLSRPDLRLARRRGHPADHRPDRQRGDAAGDRSPARPRRADVHRRACR